MPIYLPFEEIDGKLIKIMTRNQKQCLLRGTAIPTGPVTCYSLPQENTHKHWPLNCEASAVAGRQHLLLFTLIFTGHSFATLVIWVLSLQQHRVTKPCWGPHLTLILNTCIVYRNTSCHIWSILVTSMFFIIWHLTAWVWRGGVVVRVSDLQPRGRRFESWPFRFTYNPGQVVHTLVPVFTKQYKLVPAQAGS